VLRRSRAPRSAGMSSIVRLFLVTVSGFPGVTPEEFCFRYGRPLKNVKFSLVFIFWTPCVHSVRKYNLQTKLQRGRRISASGLVQTTSNGTTIRFEFEVKGHLKQSLPEHVFFPKTDPSTQTTGVLRKATLRLGKCFNQYDTGQTLLVDPRALFQPVIYDGITVRTGTRDRNSSPERYPSGGRQRDIHRFSHGPNANKVLVDGPRFEHRLANQLIVDAK
jgi:hypothetical protein